MKKLFIHIPKNGGTTIRRSPLLKNKIVAVTKCKDLVNTDYAKRLKAAMSEDGLAATHHGHARWIDVNPKLRNLPSFAIIRNPWSRVVSRYTFARKIYKENRVPGVRNCARESTHLHINEKTSFEEFLELRHKLGSRPYFWHRTTTNWYPQLHHVVSERRIALRYS